jgi:hypothetical protein
MRHVKRLSASYLPFQSAVTSLSVANMRRTTNVSLNYVEKTFLESYAKVVKQEILSSEV